MTEPRDEFEPAKYPGCCGDAAWRGHLCTFHEGYEDGLDVGASEREVLVSQNAELRAALIEIGRWCSSLRPVRAYAQHVIDLACTALGGDDVYRFCSTFFCGQTAGHDGPCDLLVPDAKEG